MMSIPSQVGGVLSPLAWESILEDMAVKLPFEGHVGFSQIKGVWGKSDPSRGNSRCKGREAAEEPEEIQALESNQSLHLLMTSLCPV